jgi:hypothetical protein
MRKAAILVAALLGVLLSPQTASADSTEYTVSINASWLGSSMFGNLCEPIFYNDCNQVVTQFSGIFDVDANGNLVPGSMVFFVSGFLSGNPFAFDTTPPTYLFENGNLQTGFGSWTSPSPFNWSDSATNTFTFIPPGCGDFVPPSTCGSASWPPTGNTTFDAASTISVDCFGGLTPGVCGLFHCADLLCPTGGDTPADGGSVVITEFTVAAPEPSSVLLFLVGLCSLLAYAFSTNNRRHESPFNVDPQIALTVT